MSVHSSFLIDLSVPFFLLLVESSGTDLKCFWPLDSKKLHSAKPKLKSAIGVY